MQLTFQCPACTQATRTDVPKDGDDLQCVHCQWTRPIRSADFPNETPQRCLVCGCDDLWRQKDFPQWLGVLFVGTGALLSTIAWYYVYPLTAIGILMGFALADMFLYTMMSDVLVCYRCAARYRRANLEDDTRVFNLETAERYRQESIRLRESERSGA
jgi:hypothetical protein